MNPPTALESVLRRDRWLLGAALALVTILCWAWIIPMARDMYGSMSGSAAWMMTARWDFSHLVLLFAMWVVMMAGMMLPSAAPAIMLYGGVVRRSPESEQATSQIYAFASGYLVVWTGFSLCATILQRILADRLFLSPMMATEDRLLGGGLLLFAGAYQLTPWKRACLQSCRSPVEFMTRHWRPGVTGGFYLGAVNGLYCLGCCWALMILLFVGGVMNLWWIGGLTIFVLLEKLAPFGREGGRWSGIALGLAGLGSIISALR